MKVYSGILVCSNVLLSASARAQDDSSDILFVQEREVQFEGGLPAFYDYIDQNLKSPSSQKIGI